MPGSKKTGVSNTENADALENRNVPTSGWCIGERVFFIDGRIPDRYIYKSDRKYIRKQLNFLEGKIGCVMIVIDLQLFMFVFTAVFALLRFFHSTLTALFGMVIKQTLIYQFAHAIMQIDCSTGGEQIQNG